MNAALTVLLLLLFATVALLAPEDGPTALVLCFVLGLTTAVAIWKFERKNEFLLRLFVGALCVRILVAILIYALDLQSFFGGDADTYDRYGYGLQQAWRGDAIYRRLVDRFTGVGGSGWGMVYLVAGIYEVIGRNPLAIQLFNAVFGAATPVLIFHIAQHVFGNTRVSRVAAFSVAFYPSLVLWSAQGLKDGPIVFLLCVAMLATLKIGEKFDFKYVVVLIASVVGLLTLRFYIFYMVLAAICGAFAIGMRAFSTQSFVRQFIVIIILGLSLTYLGVTRFATVQVKTFGDLRMVQKSRSDASQSAKSGFNEDVDVSTTGGALAAIPIGLIYLLFAPLPWQLASLRQSITLPEMIIWWVSFPLLVLGLWFTIKYRLRQISPILIFTTMLTLGYSVFQGNVGTAYRQRAQLLVFYFIFVAVGFVLFQERREDRKRRAEAERQVLANRRTERAFAAYNIPNRTPRPALGTAAPAVPADEA